MDSVIALLIIAWWHEGGNLSVAFSGQAFKPSLRNNSSYGK
jgi:hypothetical protein